MLFFDEIFQGREASTSSDRKQYVPISTGNLSGQLMLRCKKIQIKVDQSFYRGAIDMEKLLQYKYHLLIWRAMT